MPIRLLSRTIRLININNNGIIINNRVLRTLLCGCQSSYSSKPTNQTIKVVDPVTGEEKKKKTVIIPKITLISGDQLTVSTLEEAQKISKRRDLKLVKIVDLDTKTQRPVYKLMTGNEYHAEDLKQRDLKKKEKQKGNIKGEKVLIISHNITEHDLQTDIRKISKWITKSYEVRVVINGDSSNIDKAEHVYNYLESALRTEARFLQKRQKGSDIKFQIYPPKKEKTDGGEKIL
ncbi:translation initiation factor IF-3, mitochondrial [Anoplophora glabripennis]|nr:translation initiation factor IF-3, mitochondrial [Anoplophora glabripennis]